VYKFSTGFPQYKYLRINNLNTKYNKKTIIMIINGGKNGNNNK